MHTSLTIVVLLGVLGQANGDDEAKLRKQIELLERDLARMSRELDELRARVGPRDPAPKTAELLRELDGAYQSLKKETLDQESLIAAAKAFQAGDVKHALRLLRTGRPRAAIPMILKDMVERETEPKSTEKQPKSKKVPSDDHLTALTLLTGDDVETAFAKAGSAHRLVQDWWRPRQAGFVTDIGKMSPEQVATVARRLRDAAGRLEPYTANGPSYYAHALLYGLVYYREDSPDRRGPPNWFAEELHPALGPAFLAGMGYRSDGAGGQDVLDVPYQLVHLLAAMRKNSALPQLDKVAEDASQNSGVRLVCLIALNSAGEGVRVPAVLSILAREKKLDRKLAALEFLYYADDIEPATDYLLEVLDDANAEVRNSALHAIQKHPPLPLFKRLKQMAEAKHQERVLEVIAAMGTTEAQTYLANYLEKTMSDRPKTERIHDTLWAFQHATKQDWISAGRYSFDQYHGMATKALEWWKKNGGK